MLFEEKINESLHLSLICDRSICSRTPVLFISGFPQSILDSLEIPHLECHWNTMKQSNNQLSVNIYPKHDYLSMAFIDIVKSWKWKTFVIVYEANEGSVLSYYIYPSSLFLILHLFIIYRFNAYTRIS